MTYLQLFSAYGAFPDIAGNIVAEASQMAVSPAISEYRRCPISGSKFPRHFWYFSLSFNIFALLSLSFLVVTQIRGKKTGSSPSSPLRLLACISIARRLTSSNRIELRLPTLPGAFEGRSRLIISKKNTHLQLTGNSNYSTNSW